MATGDYAADLLKYAQGDWFRDGYSNFYRDRYNSSSTTTNWVVTTDNTSIYTVIPPNYSVGGPVPAPQKKRRKGEYSDDPLEWLNERVDEMLWREDEAA